MEASNFRNTLMLDTDLYTAVEDLEKLKSEMRAVAKFDQNFTTNIHRQGWSVQPDRLASTLFKTYSKFAMLLGVYKVSSITVSDLPSYPITNCKSLSLWNIFFFFFFFLPCILILLGQVVSFQMLFLFTGTDPPILRSGL